MCVSEGATAFTLLQLSLLLKEENRRKHWGPFFFLSGDGNQRSPLLLPQEGLGVYSYIYMMADKFFSFSFFWGKAEDKKRGDPFAFLQDIQELAGKSPRRTERL